MAINLRSAVPCAGCTACCKNELLMLHPEMGDKPEAYETQDVTNPLTGKPGIALKQKRNGDCTYLGDDGCTIHDRAPAICREFDCRQFFLNMGDRATRRKLLSQGLLTKEVMDAGRKRLASLPQHQRRPA